MGVFARGGTLPTLTWLFMGIAIEAIAILVDDLDGMGHVFGMVCFIFRVNVHNSVAGPAREAFLVLLYLIRCHSELRPEVRLQDNL